MKKEATHKLTYLKTGKVELGTYTGPGAPSYFEKLILTDSKGEPIYQVEKLWT